jgi:hypothetical protein
VMLLPATPEQETQFNRIERPLEIVLAGEEAME